MRMKDDGLDDSVAFAHRAKDTETWLARNAPRAGKSPADLSRPGHIAHRLDNAANRDDASGYLGFP